MKQIEIAAMIGVVVIITGLIALYGTIGYVAWHFVSKFW